MRVEHAEEKRVTEQAEADGKKPDREGKDRRERNKAWLLAPREV